MFFLFIVIIYMLYIKPYNAYNLKLLKNTKWYKNGIDHNGKIIGKHEINSLNLKVEKD